MGSPRRDGEERPGIGGEDVPRTAGGAGQNRGAAWALPCHVPQPLPPPKCKTQLALICLPFSRGLIGYRDGSGQRRRLAQRAPLAICSSWSTCSIEQVLASPKGRQGHLVCASTRLVLAALLGPTSAPGTHASTSWQPSLPVSPCMPWQQRKSTGRWQSKLGPSCCGPAAWHPLDHVCLRYSSSETVSG